MSRRILKTRVLDREATVTIGWNRQFCYYSMVIEVVGQESLLLYSNADDDDALLHGTLEYFIAKAKRLGVTIPFAMVAALQVDVLLNVNDATSYFNDSGLQTYVTGVPN